MIDIFAAVRPELQEIAAGLIEGDDDVVDRRSPKARFWSVASKPPRSWTTA